MGQGTRPRARRILAAATAAVLGALSLAGGARAAEADPGWVERALDLQYELGSAVGFRNAPWVGTHNSFNSRAEMGPALSAQDSNQAIDITAQLKAGIRSLELDVHKFLTLADGVGPRPVVCHARPGSEAHLGCTIEKPLRVVLREITSWLEMPENADQVLLLYLEDHLDDAAGYDAGAAVVREELGDLLYRPPAGGDCSEVPQSLTRNGLRGAGRQVLIVSDCGPGVGWGEVAFNWDSHVESRPRGYRDFPDCGPDFDRATYDSQLVRYYEDSTMLTNIGGPLTGIAEPDEGIDPPTAAAMARCGVDLFGLDQLTGRADPRLQALVWSWAPNRPRRGGPPCALQFVSRAFPFGRWRDASCQLRRSVACRTTARRFFVPSQRVKRAAIRRICARHDAQPAIPRTGNEAQRLRLAMEAAGRRTAWLGLRRRGQEWVRG